MLRAILADDGPAILSLAVKRTIPFGKYELAVFRFPFIPRPKRQIQPIFFLDCVYESTRWSVTSPTSSILEPMVWTPGCLASR